jgi:hypothetical protein
LLSEHDAHHLLFSVIPNFAPTRQVLRRTEFLGSLAVSILLIMIDHGCLPYKRRVKGQPTAAEAGCGCPFSGIIWDHAVRKVRKPPITEGTSVSLQRWKLKCRSLLEEVSKLFRIANLMLCRSPFCSLNRRGSLTENSLFAGCRNAVGLNTGDGPLI